MKLLTISETAVYLKVSPAMVRRLVKKHKDSICVSFGKKSTRIIAERLNVFISGNTGRNVELEPSKPNKKGE